MSKNREIFLHSKDMDNEIHSMQTKAKEYDMFGNNEFIWLISISNYIPITKLHYVNENNYTVDTLGMEQIRKGTLKSDK